MGYSEWLKQHYQKHKKIVQKLLERGFGKDEIIEYFDFENMKLKENSFCPLYAQNKKCHDIDELNCYLCSCPNFRFSDEGVKEIDGKTLYSYCDIDSKEGVVGVYGSKIHQDCSLCHIPHSKWYIKKHFDTDWMKIMQKSEL